MGGRIGVESDPGKGSVFTFTAKFKRSHEKRITAAERKDEDPAGFDAIKGAHILLVEDNEINRQMAKELLQNEGFIVSVPTYPPMPQTTLRKRSQCFSKNRMAALVPCIQRDQSGQGLPV